ncbi:hypothetical protein ACIP79_41060 [Streptomyces sp. NPDC088747]|uniref:hypothetical protein n=1 Tax=Streptomyces sp. NPDC088747 TaxID=3365886 RepID=UPI0038247964
MTSPSRPHGGTLLDFAANLGMPAGQQGFYRRGEPGRGFVQVQGGHGGCAAGVAAYMALGEEEVIGGSRELVLAPCVELVGVGQEGAIRCEQRPHEFPRLVVVHGDRDAS